MNGHNDAAVATLSGADASASAIPTRPGVSDLRAVSRLVVDAVGGVTDIVEAMHRNIARVSPVLGTAPAGRARGIAGFVYRSVRGVARSAGFVLDAALSQFVSSHADVPVSARKEAVRAALNGVLGDHLDASGNALAIPMRLRVDGRAIALDHASLALRFPAAGPRVLVLAHGLCMNDLQWRRDGHDHGIALAAALGATPLYLHYNTGRSIAANGADFAGLLEALVQAWPVPIESLAIVGHSMGGLVARSAHRHGVETDHGWPRHLRDLVFLGTPHHGAPLERLGSRVDALLRRSPYTEPLSRLGGMRSIGIRNLRDGAIVESDVVAGRDAVPTMLPDGVRCFAVAATMQSDTGASVKRLRGDGLVSVDSALGRHRDIGRDLGFPSDRQFVCHGTNHFDLLRSREVFERMKDWLAG